VRFAVITVTAVTTAMTATTISQPTTEPDVRQANPSSPELQP
jgi:hypothetical protein